MIDLHFGRSYADRENTLMTIETVDAIIIGAGQAGPALAARCSKEGLRSVIIERGHFGGTCVNVGCVPTKTLVASARAIHLARRGAEFGFDAGDIRVDMARVKARKDDIVRKSREGVEAWMRGLAHTEVIVGEAHFVAPRTVQVGLRTWTAPRVFLNLGGRSVRPALQGIDDVETLDNVSIMALDRVPEHLVIVGGSYIGLEFAQLMRRFGAEVTVVERSAQLLPREDDDVADGVRAILEAEGVRFQLGAECIALARDGARIAVGSKCDAEAPVDRRQPCAARGRASAQHRRAGAGTRRRRARRARLRRRRRSMPQQRRGRLGGG